VSRSFSSGRWPSSKYNTYITYNILRVSATSFRVCVCVLGGGRFTRFGAVVAAEGHLPTTNACVRAYTYVCVCVCVHSFVCNTNVCVCVYTYDDDARVRIVRSHGRLTTRPVD